MPLKGGLRCQVNGQRIVPAGALVIVALAGSATGSGDR